MAPTHNWDKLNPFSPPYHGDRILMPSGPYMLMRGMYGWSLYAEEGNRHPQIQDIDAMVNLLAVIYRVGNTEAFEQMVSEEAE